MESDNRAKGESLAPRTPVPQALEGQNSESGNAQATLSSAGPAMFDSTNVMISGGHITAHQGNHANVTILHPQLVQIQNQPSAQNVSPSPNPLYFELCCLFCNRRRRPDRPEANIVQGSNEMYERHLKLKGRGFPLWIPQPNIRLPIPYRAKGVCIGDVGIVTASGGFDFLFNICRTRDDPINPEELPDNFAPIYPPLNLTDVREFREFSSGSYLTSPSIVEYQTGEQIPGCTTFESSAPEGAILTMPDGAFHEELGNLPKFRNYVAVHGANWYKFVNGPLRGREAQNGDVRVVVGCDKSTSWGMATFVNTSSAQQSKFRLRFHPLQGQQQSQLNPRTAYIWEPSGRVGPEPGENEELGETPTHQLRNQCLFMRTLSVTLSDSQWAETFPGTASANNQEGFQPGQYLRPPNPNTSSSSSNPATSIQGRRRSHEPSVPPVTISELAERANIPWDESKGFKYHLKLADKCRREGKEYARSGDIENAFVELTKAATLALGRLPEHPDYNTKLKPHQRHNLSLNGQEILDNLAELKPVIVDRYEKWRQASEIAEEDKDVEESLTLIRYLAKVRMSTRQLTKKKERNRNQSLFMRTAGKILPSFSGRLFRKNRNPLAKESARSSPGDPVGSAGPSDTHDSDDINPEEPFVGFVDKLYHVTNDPVLAKYIRWTNSGTSFIVIVNVQMFAELLGPLFRHNNFSGFVRQLNMYGFQVISRISPFNQEQTWEFCHPKFMRDRPDLLHEIKRKWNPAMKDEVELPGDFQAPAQLDAMQNETTRVWVNPSKIINKYLLDQDLSPSELIEEITLMNDVTVDSVSGVVFFEPKNEISLLTVGEQSIIDQIEGGQITLEQYLFGSSENHSMLLHNLIIELRSDYMPFRDQHTMPAKDTPHFLKGHPKRLLSFDDLVDFRLANFQSLLEHRYIHRLRSYLNSSPSDDPDKGTWLLRLADVLSRRFWQLNQKDDLEEAIWYYQEALSLLPQTHYHFLEAILGFCSCVYQRFQLLGHLDDRKKLLYHLHTEHNLNLESLLTPVKAQLDQHVGRNFEKWLEFSRQHNRPKWMSGPGQELDDESFPSTSGPHGSGQPVQVPFHAAFPQQMGVGGPLGPHMYGANIQQMDQHMGRNFEKRMKSTISQTQSMVAGISGGNYDPQAAFSSSSRNIEAGLSLNDPQPQISTYLSPPTSFSRTKFDPQVGLKLTDQMGSSNPSTSNLSSYNNAVLGFHFNPYSPPLPASPFNFLPSSSGGPNFDIHYENHNHDYGVHHRKIDSFIERNNTIQDSFSLPPSSSSGPNFDIHFENRTKHDFEASYEHRFVQ